MLKKEKKKLPTPSCIDSVLFQSPRSKLTFFLFAGVNFRIAFEPADRAGADSMNHFDYHLNLEIILYRKRMYFRTNRSDFACIFSLHRLFINKDLIGK